MCDRSVLLTRLARGLAVDRNWDRVAELLERALEFARAREHPTTVRALAEEVIEECAYLQRPTTNARLAYILKQRAAGMTFTYIAAELGVSRERVRQLVRNHEACAGAVGGAITTESSVDLLDLPGRVRRSLRERGVATVAELLALEPHTTMRRIGRIGWRRIHTELARHRLGEPLAEHPALGLTPRPREDVGAEGAPVPPKTTANE
jgi:hypothetical protein